MATNRDWLLMELLHCGEYDLSLLDNVGYDWCDVIETDSTFPFDLNYVMRQVFEFGYSQIAQAVNDRICELEAIPNERELEEDEELELSELRTLEPYEDFESFHNYIDTHVWCEKHKDIYQKYMAEAIDEFGDGTGFEISFD